MRDVLRSAAAGRTVAYVAPSDARPALSGRSPLAMANAEVGLRAGAALGSLRGLPSLEPGRVATLAEAVRLPGRLSTHHRHGANWVLDTAIDRVGVAAAVAWCAQAGFLPDHVLVCVPDRKDWRGVDEALSGLPVTHVALTEEGRLSFQHSHAGQVHAENLDLPGFRGKTVLALGTVSFVGILLDRLGVDTDAWW